MRRFSTSIDIATPTPTLIARRSMVAAMAETTTMAAMHPVQKIDNVYYVNSRVDFGRSTPV